MNYYYDDPTDFTANWNSRKVYNEAMIIKEQQFHCVHLNMTREQILADWIICNWASPTDMPVGEYITAVRSTSFTNWSTS